MVNDWIKRGRDLDVGLVRINQAVDVTGLDANNIYRRNTLSASNKDIRR